MSSKVKLLIFESSYLIRQGLAVIVSELNNCLLEEMYENLGKFQLAIKHYKPQVIIIGLNLIEDAQDNFIKEMKKECKCTIIGIKINNAEPEKSYFDLIINYNDEKTELIKKLGEYLIQDKKIKKEKQIDHQLSEREKDIVALAAKGLTNKEIAGNLFISVHTAITHRKNISRKLGIKTLSGLTVYAILNKLIDMKDIHLTD
jgi:DNA-binding NarL/FixJ family response regulator